MSYKQHVLAISLKSKEGKVQGTIRSFISPTHAQRSVFSLSQSGSDPCVHWNMTLPLKLGDFGLWLNPLYASVLSSDRWTKQLCISWKGLWGWRQLSLSHLKFLGVPKVYKTSLHTVNTTAVTSSLLLWNILQTVTSSLDSNIRTSRKRRAIVTHTWNQDWWDSSNA